MDRDSITRTGARAPGVERQDRSHGGACKGIDSRHSAGASRWQQKARRVMANQRGLGRPHLIFRPWSRNGENPPYGILGRAMETAASFDARTAPLPYPTIRPSGIIGGPPETWPWRKWDPNSQSTARDW